MIPGAIRMRRPQAVRSRAGNRCSAKANENRSMQHATCESNRFSREMAQQRTFTHWRSCLEQTRSALLQPCAHRLIVAAASEQVCSMTLVRETDIAESSLMALHELVVMPQAIQASQRVRSMPLVRVIVLAAGR